MTAFLMIGSVLLTLLGNATVVKADEGSLELPRGEWKYYQYQGDSIVTIDANKTINLSWEANGYINYKVVNLDTGYNIDSSDASSGNLICTAKDTTRVRIGWQNIYNLDLVTVNYSVRITNESAKLCSDPKYNFNMYFLIFFIIIVIAIIIILPLLIYFIIRGSNKKINQ